MKQSNNVLFYMTTQQAIKSYTLNFVNVNLIGANYTFFKGSGYGYGTVPGGRWAIDTEGGHVVVSVSLIRNGYEYGRRPHGRFCITPAIVAICL